MKRYVALLIAVLFFQAVPGRQATAKRRNPRVLSLCNLVGNWTRYNRRKVRVRAIYERGAEQAWLYDPACRSGEALTDVSFDKRTPGAVTTLEQIISRDRRAWVTFEGIFRGPEPFDRIDPKLPAPIRKGLEKSHKRYGHMNSFDTTISVTRVVEVHKVSETVPSSKK